jgi:hypothetical protein
VEFSYSYQKDSLVNSNASRTEMSFAPDTTREPTFFRGELRQSVAFREAMSALHDVVVSDLRWHPKDRTEYKAWLEQQEEIDWAAVASQQKDVAGQLKQLRSDLDTLRARSADRMGPFYAARQRYFDYLYKRDYDAWFVLDPVITVHPDEVFFECFSQDESSYGRLSVGFDVFKNVGDFSCGTTNIDYSSALYDEFQKIRSYKSTSFEVDPSGFEVQSTGEEAYKEVKIDLPDSWVRGFLQVSSAMALPAASVTLHPMDVHNICFILRRRRELAGPRSMRFQLKPGDPVKIVFDPWGIELQCPRSNYEGDREEEIRVWGRRRIHILERLIPVARRFTVHLLGKGMPSIYTADLGDMTFTLGLSGWTANDWSTAGNFDLLAPRAEVDSHTKTRVFEALHENWFETPDSLASRLDLDRSVVLGALAAYTQAGRAIWDANKGVYRVRELSREPLPMDQLRFANPREQSATRFLEQKGVKISSTFQDQQDVRVLEGSVHERDRQFEPSLRIDADERIVEASCQCNWHQQNKLRKGPCGHILALRMQYARQTTPRHLLSIGQPSG